MIKAKNILLVDDNSIDNLVTETLLTILNVTEKVTTARNGKEALYLLKRSRIYNQDFDYIFLDLKMPVMDGYDLLEEIRKLGFESKIIILSGSITKSDLELDRKYEIEHYFIKPLSKNNIFEIFNAEPAMAL
jgi:CheY-like chemotaxis protein